MKKARTLLFVLTAVAALLAVSPAGAARAAGTPDHLGFDTQPPATVTAGQTMSPSVTVDVFDSTGTVVADSTDSIALTLSGGDASAKLGGTTTVNAVGGVATFDTLSVDLVGSGYALEAASDPLTPASSTPFDVTAGTVATIHISPGNATIRAGQSKDYTAEGLDGQGNDLGEVTADTTFTIDPDSGGSCTGASCKATVSGTWTVTGNDSGATDTARLQVGADDADHLVFIVQPGNGTAGQVLSTVKVAAEDQFGNVSDGTTGKVLLSFGSNPGGAALTGTNPRALANGVAILNDLTVSEPGTGYRLKADFPALDPTMTVTSASFDVTGPVGISLSVDHTTITAGQTLHLKVHLGHWFTNRTVSIYATPFGGTKRLLVSGPVGSGNWFYASSKPSNRTTFVAEYGGDSRYQPATSNTVTVLVRVVVDGSLSGYYGMSGGYHLYHYHSGCTRKPPTGCPQFTGTVVPNLVGRQLGFTLQALSRGSWKTVASFSASTDPDGSEATIVWTYSGESVKGIPLRCHASFSGNAGHLGDTGPWRFFKVTG